MNLIGRFWLIDPITEVATLADPGTVTFTVRNPDNVETSYVYGVDGNVTKVAVGVYICALDPQLPVGDYVWSRTGTAPVETEGESTFTVIESGVLAPSPPDIAVYGPCQSWISGGEVADFDTTLGIGSDTWRLDDVAFVASQLLFELSGRQFQGNCQRTVRPCRNTCGCWGQDTALGLGTWYWAASTWPGGGFGWTNESGDTCGCGNESYIRLAGYPVRQILQVKIDGDVLDPATYRLDERRNLIRLADLTNPAVPIDRFWPACQDLSLPDTEPGTYSVTYLWGAETPTLGKLAAAQLAAELWKAQPGNQGECRLPSRVTRIVRQGIEMTKIVSTADLLREGMTGLQMVDAFLAQVNPQKARMRSVAWSPDQQGFARPVGQ